MNPIDKVIFLLIKAGKPELCLSIMHLCPDIRRRGGFFQRRAEGKEQVYGGQDLVLGALVPFFVRLMLGVVLVAASLVEMRS